MRIIRGIMRGKLHPYQQYMLRQMLLGDNAALFLDPGLGKTVICLRYLEHQKWARRLRGALIIAPKPVLENTWMNEIRKWDADLSATIYEGKTTPRADITLVNPERFYQMVTRKHLPSGCTLIVDESTRFKNPSAQRFKALRKALFRWPRRFILTGTPTANGLQDLWSQIFILDEGDRLGKRITHFRDRYMIYDQRTYSYHLRPDSSTEIESKISDIAYSMRKEHYLELPDMIEVDHTIHLDEKSQAMYKEMEDTFITQIEEEGITIEANNPMLKLQQMTSGFMYDESGMTHHFHQHKVDAIRELIETIDEPILIAYTFKAEERMLRETFGMVGIEALDEWLKGDVKLLGLQNQSSVHGLNLQHTSRQLIWLSMTWSQENYVQLVSRLHRQGQSRPVMVHRLIVPRSIDQVMVKRLSGKIKVEDSLRSRIEAIRAMRG